MCFIHNMMTSNVSFKGYDVMPLRGFYMQGIRKDGEKYVFREMKNIADKEGLDIFVNQDGTNIQKDLDKNAEYDEFLSVWGQDNKAFVVNKKGKQLLCSSKEPALEPYSLGRLSDFEIDRKRYMPRGGNYYIGHKDNGEKWLIINSMTVADEKGFKTFGDLPTMKIIQDLFDVKSENICVISNFVDDIDEIIRPIGYPNVLVNDYGLSLKNLEKMKRKFPESYETYNVLKNYIKNNLLHEDLTLGIPSADTLCKVLKANGFNPIRIAGRYSEDINYMNALAFKNKKNGVSYITNSTKGTYPELEYLEKLFEKDLKNKVPEITNTYFVSGGRYERQEAVHGLFEILMDKGLKKKTVMMDILSNRGGGIHCMTAEIPDFDRIG